MMAGAMSESATVERRRPVLVTIPISHYCEKARWALDRAGVAYDERRHLPAIHRVAVRRAGGRLTAPVLVCPGGEVVAESSDIVAWADARGAVVSCDGAAVALAADYDARLGPATRLWVYHQMFDHPRLVEQSMTDGVPGWERYAYRYGNRALAFAVARVLVINDETAVEAERTFRSVFASVNELLADGRPYLAGETFSLADLTFASLSAPLIAPPEYGVRLPAVEELPPSMIPVVEEHRASVAGRHALRMFATERGAVRAAL
jgi:glutathione S-transferase